MALRADRERELQCLVLTSGGGPEEDEFLGNLLVGAECLWVVDGDSDGRAAEYSAIDRRRNGSSPTHSPNSHALLLGGWCGGKGRDRGRDREKREGWEGGRKGERGTERGREREGERASLR